MAAVGQRLPRRVPPARLPSDRALRGLRRGRRHRAAPRPDRGRARHGVRALRQPGERDHRVPGRRLLDQAPPRRAGRPTRASWRRTSRRPASPARARSSRAPTASTGPSAASPPTPARLAALAAGLGREWAIQRLMFKAYPCGSINQPYMDCAARIRTRPGSIRRRSGRSSAGRRRARSTGSGSRSRRSGGPRPPTAPSSACRTASRSSSWRAQAGVDGFSEAKTRDPRILEVAGKVRYVLDPTLPYPQRFTGHVRVELADGRVLEETQDAPRGGPEHPLAPRGARGEVPGQRGPGPARGAGGRCCSSGCSRSTERSRCRARRPRRLRRAATDARDTAMTRT